VCGVAFCGGNIKATIVAAAQGGRYKVSSNNIAAMSLLARELELRLRVHQQQVNPNFR
jgi:hypothetical protein